VTYINTDRERVSSENGYLTPGVLVRPNLQVAVNATVTRVLLAELSDSKRATGVEFTSSQNCPLFQARSRKEVIVWLV